MADIVDTPGSSSANSYASLDFAESYFETRLGSSAWTSETDEDKQIAALIQATRVLDATFNWNGWIATDTQALRWPREGAVNYDQAFGPNSMYDFDSTLTAYFPNDEVPLQIKNATCELAIWLLENGGYSGAVNDLDSVRVGPIRIDFNNNVSNYAIPNTVMEMLTHMGTFIGTVGGSAMRVATLMRT